MPKLTCTIPGGYSGLLAPDDIATVTVAEGGTFDVPDAKAEQLLADFPDGFTIAGESTEPPAPGGDDLEALTVEELRARLPEDANVPAKATKAVVIDALRQADADKAASE